MDRAVPAAALAAAALLATACGSGSDTSATKPGAERLLNITPVEAAIRQSIREQRKTEAEVTCPTVVEQRAGNTFECTAKSPKGDATFTVTQVNSAGSVTYAAR